MIMCCRGPSKFSEDEMATALQQQADEDGKELPVGVRELIESWSAQPGYPVVKVERDYNANTATISQVSECTW